MKILTDKEIIGDFCSTCDFSCEGCIEHGDQPLCVSYQEALRQKKVTAQAQLSHCEQERLKELQEIKSGLEAGSYVNDGLASATTIDKFRTIHYRESKWQAFWKEQGL